MLLMIAAASLKIAAIFWSCARSSAMDLACLCATYPETACAVKKAARKKPVKNILRTSFILVLLVVMERFFPLSVMLKLLKLTPWARENFPKWSFRELRLTARIHP